MTTKDEVAWAHTQAGREKLRQYFLDKPIETHSERWDNLWKDGTFLPWDRNMPSAALVDALNDRKDLLGDGTNPSTGKPKRALVPGCGKGYDVLLLASHGYDAYGLDVSENAVKACEDFARENWAAYAANGPAASKGSCHFICADFFKDDWLDAHSLQGGFDFIYDYTFLCALPPQLRPAWSLRQSTLLAHGDNSRLVCLEFPTFRAPNTGGPPHGLKPEMYMAHLGNPGQTISYDSEGMPEKDSYERENSNPDALVRIGHWKPERTHEVGKGTDSMSVWRHRASNEKL